MKIPKDNSTLPVRKRDNWLCMVMLKIVQDSKKANGVRSILHWWLVFLSQI